MSEEVEAEEEEEVEVQVHLIIIIEYWRGQYPTNLEEGKRVGIECWQ